MGELYPVFMDFFAKLPITCSSIQCQYLMGKFGKHSARDTFNKQPMS